MPLKYMHSYASSYKYIHKYFLYSLGYEIAWWQSTDILYSWGNTLYTEAEFLHVATTSYVAS